jgi:ubiquitin-protein ligase
MTPQTPAQPAVAWSPPQLIRLENEWRRLQRSFACHPFVNITPLSGDPPAEFQVQYRVRTLAFNQQNQLTYVTSCPIHIWLPPQFPHAPPAVRPMAPIFHPNVTMEWIYLPVLWNATLTLEQVVTLVGRLLAYQTWDPTQNANPVAMDWLAQNQHLCPTDPVAFFNPDTEGDPLSRIMRSGGEQLEQIRNRLTKMCDRLVLVPPPDAAEVRRFAQQARQLLNLFSEPDIPDEMRSAAGELDEVALSMLAPNSAWEALGREFASTNGTALAAENAAQAIDAMRAAQQALAKVAPPPVNAQAPLATVTALPPAVTLQPLLSGLRRAVRDAEQKAANLRSRAAELEREASALPEVEASPGSMLHERLTAEVARAREVAAAAKQRVAEVAADAEPAVAEGKRELTASERVVEWAEYADLLKRADALVAKIVQLGPAGIQSYTLKVGEKVLGPFEYEQRLDDAVNLRYAVSNLGTAAIDLIDTRSGVATAHADAGEISISVKGKNDQPVTVTVVPAEHDEELRVQFEYLVTQSKEKFAKLSVLPDVPAAPSWLGNYESFFRSLNAREAIAADNKTRRQRWKGLLLDLTALGKFKLRVATYFQLERVAELVPRVQAEIARSRQRLAAADVRLAEIAAKSGRDLETEQLVVPAKLVKEYSERTAERDRALRDIPRFQKLLQNAAAQLRLRLSVRRLTGSEGLPSFYVLAPLAERWAGFEAVLQDADMYTRVEQIEQALGMPLRPQAKPLFGVAPEAGAAPFAPHTSAAAAAAVSPASSGDDQPPADAALEPTPTEGEYAEDPGANREAYADSGYAKGEGGEYVEPGHEPDAPADPFAIIEDDSLHDEE